MLKRIIIVTGPPGICKLKLMRELKNRKYEVGSKICCAVTNNHYQLSNSLKDIIKQKEAPIIIKTTYENRKSIHNIVTEKIIEYMIKYNDHKNHEQVYVPVIA